MSRKTLLVRLLMLLVVPAAAMVATSPVSGAESSGLTPKVVTPLRYVALGDSYSAGEGNPPFVLAACDRSLRAWPNLLAGLSSTDRLVGNLACSGAKATNALFTSYNGQAPQLTAMAALNPDLVSVTIGGNDIGFAPVLEYCYLASFLGHPDNCSAVLVQTGQIVAALGSTMPGFYHGIKAFAPHAKVVVVGYPRIFPLAAPRDIGCNWLSSTNRQLANALVAAIDQQLAIAASTAGVTYISTLNALSGHELCTSDSWLNPIGLAGNTAYDAHPNAAGQQALASAVYAAIG